MIIPNPKAWHDPVAEADSGRITPPSKSASTAKWLEYAKASGLDEEDLGDTPNRSQIIEVLTVAGVPTE